ncbi:MAG: hypothetical protein J6A02_07185 [Prevotella sp.]|nr:hypothetical protein [Prevotella sp.]
MLKILVRLSFVLSALLLVACSDNYNETDMHYPIGTPVEVQLRLSPVGSYNATRAEDVNAKVEEMMNSWVVIVVNNQDNKIEKIIKSGPISNLEQDGIADVILTVGEKTVYSFANISLTELATALNVQSLSEGNVLTLDNMKAALFSPNGNNWDGTNGIPMSNWQTITVTGPEETHNLFVCRMIAKLEFQIKNITGKEIKIKNISISDITPNGTETKLMPVSTVTSNEASEMQPNLPERVNIDNPTGGNNNQSTTVNVLNGTEEITIANNETKNATVYLNESKIDPASRYGLFMITLTIDKEGTNEEVRYALVSNDNEKWTYIARNDYRIIPIVLDDYKLDIIPIDYPPIGVYPASVKEEDGTFTCTSHAAGEFSLQPVVTRYSTGEQLEYGSSENTWSYVDKSWTISNPNSIYEKEPTWNVDDHCFEGSFNNNTGEAYHEFSVLVNKGNSAQQTLTYRLWVIRK